MNRNPEFQRQIWLNWSPALLLWSLGLSALILALPTLVSNADQRAGALAWTAMAGLWLSSAVYGSVLAARSLSEEARHNTWDWQRLSALSPWQMAWGKLLGAALPAWIYTLWFATALLFISVTWISQAHFGWHTVLLAILWGLSCQTWSMNAVLIGWGARRRRAAWLPLVFLVLLPGSLLQPLAQTLFQRQSQSLQWWGLPIGSLGAGYLFGALLLGLGLLGLWRQLSTRLDIPTLPWAWPLGLTLAGFSLGGLFQAGLAPALGWTACLALIGTAYVALQSLQDGLRAWRQVQWRASHGDWTGLLQALPLWPVSWLLAMLASALCLLWPTSADWGLPIPAYSALVLGLQLLRDALLLTGFSLLVGRMKSPLAGFCVTWLVLNLILPLLAMALPKGIGMGLIQPFYLLGMVQDNYPYSAWLWLPIAAHLLLAAIWVGYLFRQRVLGFVTAQQLDAA